MRPGCALRVGRRVRRRCSILARCEAMIGRPFRAHARFMLRAPAETGFAPMVGRPSLAEMRRVVRKFFLVFLPDRVVLGGVLESLKLRVVIALAFVGQEEPKVSVQNRSIEPWL